MFYPTGSAGASNGASRLAAKQSIAHNNSPNYIYLCLYPSAVHSKLCLLGWLSHASAPLTLRSPSRANGFEILRDFIKNIFSCELICQHRIEWIRCTRFSPRLMALSVLGKREREGERDSQSGKAGDPPVVNQTCTACLPYMQSVRTGYTSRKTRKLPIERLYSACSPGTLYIQAVQATFRVNIM